ncbi:hypothetical protein [Alicyclobacillus fodiniaquatilis]|jgi:hypothetical protein|uniref:DUF4025 domain-containing protein n=1 Tax=Alicyclobacillus fodiniaquatilis TaxID=1661150 RepID=A0ABW4JGA4_9BACL
MKEKQKKLNATQDNLLESPNSGAYNPGPVKAGDNDYPTAELAGVQQHIYDLAVEEFPEGPYGAAHNAAHLGKETEWKPGQAVSGRFRDSNMIRSDRTVATEEDDFKGQAPGSIEGQS